MVLNKICVEGQILVKPKKKQLKFHNTRLKVADLKFTRIYYVNSVILQHTDFSIYLEDGDRRFFRNVDEFRPGYGDVHADIQGDVNGCICSICGESATNTRVSSKEPKIPFTDDTNTRVSSKEPKNSVYR